MIEATKIQERALDFLRLRAGKPRTTGLTEIRGPYYTPMGRRTLEDLFETMGMYVDILKFAGGSFAVMPRQAVRQIIDLCHAYDVSVSTGGFIEYVLTQGPDAVERYLAEVKDLGFDIVEVSSGFITAPEDDLVRLVEDVMRKGLKVKPEVGIQFGAGGATATAELESQGVQDVGRAIRLARRYLEAGAPLIMIESEGITESVRAWRTDVISKLVDALGLEKLLFEAADPDVFEWYVTNYGPEVNLFVDHSQIVRLECLRAGIWGTKNLWGRVVTYKPAP
ncbi:MAG: phosphosulfolactate synthase [Planctomycetes bacterium]|nr:phosphosulfolactate synthase [Planctomycetota bacterium]